ncbi:response regulator [Melaminivora sp.]|uniref:response regulator n=1 Tax=Melaminivora sp. TaxID=1933032 RepID=UPI0028AD383D|nr:response regulator [Melaminivora sp.]
MRILYVEDSSELRDTITLLMEGPGRSIVACASAEEALGHAAVPGAFELLVSDVSLPGMSGIELCRILLARDSRLRVVLCSGYHVSDGLPDLGTRVHLLHKPFDIDVLESLLEGIQAEVEGEKVA